MPDVYISRAGMVSNEIEERFTSTELGELKEKLEKQEQENRIMKEKINYLTNQFTMFTSLNKKQKENLEDLNSTIASSE